VKISKMRTLPLKAPCREDEDDYTREGCSHERAAKMVAN
jgi:hypothetical protein